jgi:hypothetical protein
MRPTLEYIIEKFDYYNQLCFDGKLKRPPILLNTRYAELGITKQQLIHNDDGTCQWSDPWIEISVRQDLPEYEYIDTIVHEMIHYYIVSNGLKDDSDHGTIFCQKMKEITEKYGIRITITYNPTEDEQIATKTRDRFICVANGTDGHTYFAVVAKNKLFRFWDIIPQIEGVSEVHWFVSDRRIFEKYPVAVSPSLMYIDAGKIHHYLTGARELENTGVLIREKQTI